MLYLCTMPRCVYDIQVNGHVQGSFGLSEVGDISGKGTQRRWDEFYREGNTIGEFGFCLVPWEDVNSLRYSLVSGSVKRDKIQEEMVEDCIDPDKGGENSEKDAQS